MPLNIDTLVSEILTIIDKADANFVGFPMSVISTGVVTSLNIFPGTTPIPPGIVNPPGVATLTATNWSKVALAYFTQLAVPVVSPPTHALAQTAFQSAMAGVLTGPGSLLAAKALSAGFAAYAGALLTGVVVPGTTTPPVPTLPNIANPPPVIPPIPADPRVICQSAAAAIAGSVDVWARTGTFTPAGAPTPILWS